MKRVPLWVTGVGLVTPLGAGVEATWSRLVRGDRAIEPVQLFQSDGQRAARVGQVAGVVVEGGPESMAWSRTSAMALSAATEAMRSAGVHRRAERVGLVVGGTTGGMFENERALARLHAEPESRETVARMLSHPLTATGDCLVERLGPFARVRTLSSACSSGANAIVVGASWLLAGDVDVVVAGGADGLCRLTLSGFNALGALDPEPCRPFDRRRRGTNLGEGAGFLVLERANTARVRAPRRRPIAELAGWAIGSEAHHITNPAASGDIVTSLILRAMSRAGLSPQDIDYVNAHGTGTPLNDAMEARALARALGGEVARVPVSSSKAQIGHTLGGAGAIEAVITALVVSRRTLVPTAGLDEPDTAIPLVHVPHVGRQVARVRAAVSNAFGFGGMDTVLVFAEPDGAETDDAPASVSDGPVVAVARPGRSSARPVVVTGAALFGVCGLFGSRECAGLPGRPLSADASVDPDPYLDPVRARRFDRAARLGAVAVERALREAGGDRARTGVVLGSAYGNVDGSAAFVHRLFERGPRAASPADFPNLVPSSAVGHISIYSQLHGPSFTTADLAASGESAFAQATQLVGAGEADRIVAGAVEPKSDIVERVLAALFADAPSLTVAARTDLAVALVVEGEREAIARGAGVLARVHQVVEWRGDAGRGVESLQSPASGARCECVVARDHSEARRLLAGSAWGAAPVLTCAPALGESDALGAAALAVAVGRIAMGRADEALVVGLARGRGYAIVLGR